MLAYVLSENQWKDKIINNQHIFNESTLYILSVHMLLFSNYLSPFMRYCMGFVLITIVFIFVVYNTIIMLLFSCKLMILIIRRAYYRRRHRHLRGEVKSITDHV